ncbi:MAG: DUF4105 domain-containing protein [Gemmatimonadetes bacterium]|nr:DUF4105 domain-containing protein [Gemmatimonadota bacterium]
MQQASEPQAAERGAQLRVWLMTIGQGDQIWERFGHNAIRVLDETTGIDAAWNYGVFDAYEPGYVGRLVRGTMMYWLEPWDTRALIDAYIRRNRSVWMQELNLTPAQRADLDEFLMWNGRDENRFYRYDYYRDNCSTRVRDAIDRVLGGQLATALQARTDRPTYRDHTQRLLADRLPEWTGTLIAMGPRADRPLDTWEEAFLPVQLMEEIATVEVRGPDGTPVPLVASSTILFEADRAPEWAAPPERATWYLAAGLVAAALMVAFAVAMKQSRSARLAFHALAFSWALLAGVLGTFIVFLWGFTDHTFTANNENVLQASPLSLALAVLIPFGARLRARATRLAFAIAALSLLGFVLQILPGLDQPNGEIIALTLPVHAGLAIGLMLAPPKASSRQDS